VTDEVLMLAVRDGDLAKLGLLFERYHRALFDFLSRMTGDRTAAEDLVQDVFVRILKYRALMHDPNVNVRLATVDALQRFAEQPVVRRGSIEALDRATSPLVQIALIDFLVEFNARESVATLSRLSQDSTLNDAVRARAAWGLQQVG
jgi:HEAT repeat protein